MKKLIQLSLLLTSAVFTASCASTHEGNVGQSVGGTTINGMVLSAANIENNKKVPFQLIEVTIENTSDDWLRIHQTQMYVADPAQSKISAVVGPDLKAWAEAKRFQLLKDRHNDEIAQSALLLGGSVLATNSKDGSGAQAAGALMAVGSAAWIVTDAIQYSLAQATQSEKVPENHIFHSATVPGKSFIRRWLLVNRPSGVQLRNVVLLIETVDGKKEYVDIKLTM